MWSRRSFLGNSLIMGAGISLLQCSVASGTGRKNYRRSDVSGFARRLKPLNRILELEGYYVWGTSPIYGPDGQIHLFFSRWEARKGMGGWINGSEIAHAVADHPGGPYRNIQTILAPRGGAWFDATTCHNPHIQCVNGTYYLFYIGSSNGKTNSKRIAVATAPSPDGPWERPDRPLLEAGQAGAWDDHCSSNPAFLAFTGGEYRLYYKSWNSYEYDHYTDPAIRGNRKYGVAMASDPAGPYVKYPGNPIIDYASLGQNRQLEDGYLFRENGRIYMLARDMGRFGHQEGILLESGDGLHWSEPRIAWFGVSHYVQETPGPPYLKKYGRFERPQLLIRDGKPTHLFLASQGGKVMTSSAFVFEISPARK
ncbi:MAG TPA: glycoside hydrolase family protein [Prolixibacteraceae bacterium]|nr:glycoside hydrolase family protein [Prolixibacteraceae bacterium]